MPVIITETGFSRSWSELLHSTACIPALMVHFNTLLCAWYLRFGQWRIFAGFGGKTTHLIAEGHAVGRHVVRLAAWRLHAVTWIWVVLLRADDPGRRRRWHGSRYLSVGSDAVSARGRIRWITNSISDFLDWRTRLKWHHLLGCGCCSGWLVHTKRRRSLGRRRCRIVGIVIVHVLFRLVRSVRHRARCLYHKQNVWLYTVSHEKTCHQTFVYNLWKILNNFQFTADALVCLHWLRMPEQVQYKILVYKVLLCPLNYVADLPGRRPPRSAGTNRLASPPIKLTTIANWTFPDVSPQTWNDLPDDVTSAESLFTFRHRLKTHLFTESFFWLFPVLGFT